jgi:hypothetical protein
LPENKVIIWLDILNSIGIFLKDAAFNEANWVFAYTYYTIARWMPYCMKGESVPAEMQNKDHKINVTFIILNLLIPLLQGVAYWFSDTTALNKPSTNIPIQICVVISKFSVASLQLVSVCFLGYGILQIRKQVNSGDGTDQINVKILVIHLFAFGLYLLSTLNYFVFFSLFYLGNGTSVVLFIAIAISNTLCFFEQLCICNIFWQLAKRVPDPSPTRPSQLNSQSPI